MLKPAGRCGLRGWKLPPVSALDSKGVRKWDCVPFNNSLLLKLFSILL